MHDKGGEGFSDQVTFEQRPAEEGISHACSREGRPTVGQCHSNKGPGLGVPLACPKDVVMSKRRRGGGLEALDKAGDDCGFDSGWEAWEDPEQRSHWFF